MARIIRLKRQDNLPAAVSGNATSRDGTAAGEVVLFPGVRYERWSDGPAHKSSQGRRSPAIIERDWLEI